ncbi:MAG: hypothetical protein LIP03_11610 [Bacteroidales bacterium]|nr:hypothetical protein [Bacteroidales bacterium]
MRRRFIFIGCLALCIVMVPSVSFGQKWHRDSVECRLSQHALEPVEGIWQFPADGATLCIMRASESTFDIHLLDSPRLDIPAGTKVGELTDTPTKSRYDGSLDASKISNAKIKKSRAVVDVADGYLRFKPYSDRTSVSFRRWLPYFMRMTITKPDNPDGLIGAKRVYPIDTDNFKPCL